MGLVSRASILRVVLRACASVKVNPSRVWFGSGDGRDDVITMQQRGQPMDVLMVERVACRHGSGTSEPLKSSVGRWRYDASEVWAGRCQGELGRWRQRVLVEDVSRHEGKVITHDDFSKPHIACPSSACCSSHHSLTLQRKCTTPSPTSASLACHTRHTCNLRKLSAYVVRYRRSRSPQVMERSLY